MCLTPRPHQLLSHPPPQMGVDVSQVTALVTSGSAAASVAVRSDTVASMVAGTGVMSEVRALIDVTGAVRLGGKPVGEAPIH